MTSLLLMDLDKSDRLKKQRELRTLFDTLMEEGHQLIGAEHCTLLLVDADGPNRPRGAHPAAPPDGSLRLAATYRAGEHLFSLGMRGKSPSEAELRRAFDAYDVKARVCTPPAAPRTPALLLETNAHPRAL